MAGRPVSRNKRVTGSGSVHRRGGGLGTGRVGSGSGHTSFSGGGSSGYRGGSGGGFGGIGGLIILIIMLLFGGISGLSNLSGSGNESSSSTSGDFSNLSSYLFNNGYGSGSNTNYEWSSKANTGVLDETVAEGARDKYTVLKGDGEDTFTIMVYMCGTDLESRSAMASKDLQEMLNATLSDKINLLVYTGGCSSWRNTTISSNTNQIYQVKDGSLTLLKDDIGDLAMTDPNTLSDFIKWDLSK